MNSRVFRFDSYLLDCAGRRLTRDGAPVALSGRYLDALTLMVAEPGTLITKDRFMDEVWRGVPVTDEALTQCVASLRRALGDRAGAPRFIETVPKYGYRFIGEVRVAAKEREGDAGAAEASRGDMVVRAGMSGTAGAGLAGLIGGAGYGLAAAAGGVGGEISVLAVMVALTLGIALIGGAALAFAVSAARTWQGATSPTMIVAGALAGLVVGGGVHLIASDAFDLMLGAGPVRFTGAGEGMALGGASGLACWLAMRLRASARGAAVLGAAIGMVAGASIALAGGRLMAGSLQALADGVPGSRLSLDALGEIVGESGFGARTLLVTTALEAALFAACVAGGLVLSFRRFRGGAG